ncbi:MAG TPA: KH domain-containing protein [Candidatus Dormibacteraeota bacterium]|jgi:predicted RNA-binding protein YlqC (UPF0109 family)|nr:KH domain-containing protein [Candidatus Dormibacteraeota bacterium]
MTDYAELALFITRKIVNDPDAVAVRVRPGGRQTVVEIKVAPEDMGKLIGKGGRNIDALRAVIRAAGLRHRQRVQVDVG